MVYEIYELWGQFCVHVEMGFLMGYSASALQWRSCLIEYIAGAVSTLRLSSLWRSPDRGSIHPAARPC